MIKTRCQSRTPKRAAEDSQGRSSRPPDLPWSNSRGAFSRASSLGGARIVCVRLVLPDRWMVSLDPHHIEYREDGTKWMMDDVWCAKHIRNWCYVWHFCGPFLQNILCNFCEMVALSMEIGFLPFFVLRHLKISPSLVNTEILDVYGWTSLETLWESWKSLRSEESFSCFQPWRYQISRDRHWVCKKTNNNPSLCQESYECFALGYYYTIYTKIQSRLLKDPAGFQHLYFPFAGRSQVRPLIQSQIWQKIIFEK